MVICNYICSILISIYTSPIYIQYPSLFICDVLHIIYIYIYVWSLFHHVMILGNITCSTIIHTSNVYLRHTYNVLHCYDNVRMSQVPLVNLQREQPHCGEGFLFLMDAFMIHVLFSRVVVALRSLWWEGGVTYFPPRINTILGVTCSSSPTLLVLVTCFHILVSEIHFFFVTCSSLDLRRLFVRSYII